MVTPEVPGKQGTTKSDCSSQGGTCRVWVGPWWPNFGPKSHAKKHHSPSQKMDDSLPIPYHPKKPQQNLPEIEGHQDLRLDLQLARHMTWPMSIDFHPNDFRMCFHGKSHGKSHGKDDGNDFPWIGLPQFQETQETPRTKSGDFQKSSRGSHRLRLFAAWLTIDDSTALKLCGTTWSQGDFIGRTTEKILLVEAKDMFSQCSFSKFSRRGEPFWGIWPLLVSTCMVSWGTSARKYCKLNN